MSVQHLALDSFWVDKFKYTDAEQRYYEQHQSETPLADEVARARERLLEMKRNVENEIATTKDIKTQTLSQKVDSQSTFSQTGTQIKNTDSSNSMSSDFTSQSFVSDVSKFMEKKMVELVELVERLKTEMDGFGVRLAQIENRLGSCTLSAIPPAECKKPEKVEAKVEDDDDDVDLFGSDSDEEETKKRNKEVLEAYHAKKSKKPALIAKSSIILDVKPWDDETSMKDLEVEVRKITMDGLLWGASKLVPLAFGIHKLQINCVVEDDKVSVDELQEKIEAIEDFVQSVDIAAFNKI